MKLESADKFAPGPFRAADASAVHPSGAPVVIVVAADDRFALHLTVALHSALVRIERSRSVQVYVLDGGIAPRNVARMRACMARAHPSALIAFIRPDMTPLAGFHLSARQTTAVWLRLLIPALLPETIERVLYFDADVVVTEDVSPLFDMDLAGRALWAVGDRGRDSEMARLRRDFPAVRFRDGASYFNSGVMLIDLPEWRRRGIIDLACRFVREQGRLFAFHDQDALNLAFAGDWGLLPEKWNNQINGRKPVYPHLAGAPGGQGILHFAGGKKPWHPGRKCLHEEEYFAAVLRTGWHDPLGRLRLKLDRALDGVLTRGRGVVRSIRRGARRIQSLRRSVLREDPSA